jgi:L-lactate dehydrogenase complex protein LldF
MSRPVDQAKNAETFLSDMVHEERLDKLLWAGRMRRDVAARQVPEWEELRTLASEIKEHTLSNLSDYMIQFEARATANGVTVHWAGVCSRAQPDCL